MDFLWRELVNGAWRGLLGFVAFVLGWLIFGEVGKWLFALRQVARERSAESKADRYASVTLKSPAPRWLVAAALIVYFAHAESWATPVFYGALIGMCFCTLSAAYLVSKTRRSAAAKRNSTKADVWALSIAIAVTSLSIVGYYGGIGFWFFIIAGAFVAGLVMNAGKLGGRTKKLPRSHET